MGIIKEIKCNIKGCKNSYKEKRFNEGFPGWVHIQGIVNGDGESPYICPICKDKYIYPLIKGD